MNSAAVKEGKLLWEPSEERKAAARLTRYTDWLSKEKGLRFHNYEDLWAWSVSELPAFWESVWKFFDVRASKPYTAVLEGGMPGARWFQGAELNYAEHAFRHMTAERPALMFKSETRPLTTVSWEDLRESVASVAAVLRQLGVQKGDRVAAYLPNIPQAVIAFLAAASIGAIWSSCSPDFGTRSVVDRFRQIDPKVLFAVDGYHYGGKAFSKIDAVKQIQYALPSLKKTVLVPYLEKDEAAEPSTALEDMIRWEDVLTEQAELTFEQVPFDHPLWIVYSSGTTGLPKGLVHGHGGILIEFLKFKGLNMDVREGDRFFWFSTTGWVMWNIVQGSLLLGAVPVLFDGNPGFPDMFVLWKLAEDARVTQFGVSAAFITACMNEGLTPGRDYDLSALRTIGSTGSPLPPEGFGWVYDKVKRDVWLASVSGGTDVASGFLSCSPWLPVHAGELQCRGLGVKALAFDDEGNELTHEVGELVIAEPMPSMPLFLWNDTDDKRYVESYFDMYPGIWRHGDWIKITSRGSAVISGRSDSTLNRQGVRMGSSEIYSAVEDLPEIADSLVVGYERGGGYHMPLFVVPAEGIEMDDDLKKKINQKIRSSLSPRHVPDDIIAIPEVPRTLNAKKLEVPVKKILMGAPLEKAVNVDSMANPDAIRVFMDIREKGFG